MPYVSYRFFFLVSKKVGTYSLITLLRVEEKKFQASRIDWWANSWFQSIVVNISLIFE